MDAVKIIRDARWRLEVGDITREQYEELIAPLRDVETVVRCRDCKYNSNPPECGNAACVLFYGMTDQMGFCHHGERRERE